MKYLLNGKFSYNRANWIEKILAFYLEFFSEDSHQDFIRLIGVDPFVP
jgi:hypothetical protein